MNTFKQELENLPHKITEAVSMIRIAGKALAIIRARTGRGEFLTGVGTKQSIDTSRQQYSTKPCPIPYGKYLALMNSKPPEGAKIFRSKSGHVMVIVAGGYKRIREMAKKQSDHVVMGWTGRMMRDFSIIKQGETDAILGFKESESARIARYHNIEGAGKSKVKHPFIGFTLDEENQLAGLAQSFIDKALK